MQKSAPRISTRDSRSSSIWRVKRRCSTRYATRSRPASLRQLHETTANRYQSASISSPRRASRDWNRTFDLTPTAPMRGGALLIHGLTDGPYSMRAVADALQARGYYALSLRMPGHGTVPGALTQATAEDWMAAVRMGARTRAPDDRRRSPDGAGRLLQRRRPGDALRSRGHRRRAAARPVAPGADFTDDRRVAARADGAGD